MIDRRDRFDVEHPDMRITGYHRVDNLARLHTRGSLVTKALFDAGDRYRKDWELAMHSGLPARDYAKVHFGGSNVTLPLNKVAALTRFREATEYVGPTLVPLLQHVTLANKTLKDWGNSHDMNASVALGRLSAALDRLYEHYVLVDQKKRT